MAKKNKYLNADEIAELYGLTSNPGITWSSSSSANTWTIGTNVHVSPVPERPKPREDTPLSWLDNRIEEVTKLAFA